jgi:RNA polymerase sigma factor (sigma-70 family)
MDSNDQTLLNKWYQHGDAEAFHQITRRYAGLVYSTCRRILRNPSDAEDVAQECFETLAVKTRADGCALGAWLHTVATRRALDRIKTESRRRDREQRAYVAQPAQETTDWAEIYTFVDESIADLPEKVRVPLVAHFLEGRTHAEIAERMGVSRPTVGYRIQQGLERIRKDLKRRNITTSSASLGAALGAGLATESAPATLIAGLGKISVSSLPAMANSATPLIITTTIAGSMLMKKALIAGAVIAAIAGGAGMFLRNHNAVPIPPATIAPPAYEPETTTEIPETSTPERAAGAATAPESAPQSPPEAPPSPLAVASGNGEMPDSSNAGLGDLAIAGRVVDSNEKPIKGVFIQIFGKGGNPHVRTNDDGTFRLTGLVAGTYTGHASHNRYSDESLPMMEAGDENVLVVLQGRAVVSGRVVDARTGLPVSEFAISSQDGIASKVKSDLTREHHSVSDPRGRFELSSVETGPSTIVVRAEGYATAFTPLELESTEAVKDIEIALQAGILVEGRVLDDAGNPVAGAWIFTETPPPSLN